MRRLAIVVGVLAVAAAAALGLGAAAGGGGSGYRVLAVFDNASGAVPGMDVKIAGARVGRIASLDVTAEKKAALELRIERPGFAPFRAGARCTIRPQSLIGEKFVECDPGRAGEPELPDGATLRNTSSPVDLDLVNDIMRLPYRQRLSILLAELGTGLAGRGRDLNEAIHRANPALRETDRVLRILARQNEALARLVADSDAVIAPLARERGRVAGFVTAANRTAGATAERSADIERTLRRLPPLLRELRPLMADLGRFSGEATPVLADLSGSAPGINRFVAGLGPFSEAAIPATASLGETADAAGPALERARPLLRDLRGFAVAARRPARDLDAVLASLDSSGGLERLMEFLFYQSMAVNGFDELGHYLRAGITVNLCSTYAVDPTAGCSANFTQQRASGAAALDYLLGSGP